MCNNIKFGPVVQERYFKDFSIFSSGGYFFQQSGTVCTILVEGLIRNINLNLF